MQALQAGYTVEDVWQLTQIDRWFLHKLLRVVNMESYLKQLTKCVIAFVYLSLFYSFPTPFNILFIFCVFVHVPVYDDYVYVPSSYLLEWAPLALTAVKHKNVKNSTEDKMFVNVGMFVFGNAACQMTFFFLCALFIFFSDKVFAIGILFDRWCWQNTTKKMLICLYCPGNELTKMC